MFRKFMLVMMPLLLAFSLKEANAQSAASAADQPAITARKTKTLPPRPKPLRTELSAGYRLTSDGWNIYVDKGYVKSDEPKLSDQFYNLRIFQLEFGEHKDRTQAKQRGGDNSGSEQTKPFIFGKVNNFFALKLGYGVRRLIAGKPEPGTVSIHVIGAGGFSLGMEKPYYLEAYAPQDNAGSPLVRQSIKYSDANRDYFLNNQYIVGASGFSKGLSEIKFVPGIHAKTGLHFDFAANKKNVLAVEAGINAELYFRKVQIMVRDEGTPYFVSLFAAIQFGKRW